MLIPHEVNRIRAADGRRDDRSAAYEAEWDLSRNHSGSEDRASLDVNQIHIEAVLPKQTGLAHYIGDSQGSDRGGIADDKFF